METSKKLQKHFQRILEIRYDNPNGGAYAYVQFLAYSRELLTALKPYRGLDRQVDAIEGINWLFNECLTGGFSPKNKNIFDEKMHTMKNIFDFILESTKMQVERPNTWRILHAQAA